MFTEAMRNNMTLGEKLRYDMPLSESDLDDVRAEAERDIEKAYESPTEQSNFRAEALYDILRACDRAPCRYKETKELIATIRNIIEESYVEL